MNGPNTATANWKTQYLVTFAINPSSSATTSPSGTNMWEDFGTLQISATPFIGYTFTSWLTDSGNLTIANVNSAITTATINGPGTITANLSTILTATPTPTPAPTPTATTTPTPTPAPTPTISQSPTASNAPSSSPTPTTSSTPEPANSTTIPKTNELTQTKNDFNDYLRSSVVAVAIAIVLVAIVMISKYKKSQRFQ